MGKYVITERGKIAIAIVVMFFLIMPSLILVFWLMTRNTNSNETFTDRSGSIQNNSDPADSEKASEAAAGSSHDPLNNKEPESHDPSLTGVKSFDFEAGIMSFLFTPELQTAIDDNTIHMIGELLASPQNTGDRKIAVEIPQLSDESTLIITTAIIDAFNTHDIPVNDIIFLVYQPEADIRTSEISISFQ